MKQQRHTQCRGTPSLFRSTVAPSWPGQVVLLLCQTLLLSCGTPGDTNTTTDPSATGQPTTIRPTNSTNNNTNTTNTGTGAGNSSSADTFTNYTQSQLEAYCTSCHSYMSDYNAVLDNQTQIERRIVNKSMPPAGSPAPAQSTIDRIQAWFDAGAPQ